MEPRALTKGCFNEFMLPFLQNKERERRKTEQLLKYVVC